jgi:sugar porter (SP) family MFS transporter
MKPNLFFITFVAALGGFLFGFDTAVISGTDPFVVPYFKLTDAQWGWTVSSALLGTIIGALVAGFPARALGRKNSLFITGVLYFFSSLGCALAPEWSILVISRFVGGIGVGLASVLSPMFIAEMSPAKIRGRLVGVAQLNIVIGILVAYFSNKALIGFDDNWRYMFGAMMIPSFLFVALLFFVPESPRWLVSKGRDEDALKTLQSIYVDPNEPVTIIGDIKETLVETQASFTTLFDKKYRFITMLAFFFGTLNQFTGINVFIYYAPRILEKTGMPTEEALWQTFLAVGVTNLIATVGAMLAIDKFGRKTLMWIGSFGLFFSLAAMSVGFASGSFDKLAVLIALIAFIASFAMSQGAVMWVFLAEVFPNQLRNHGQSVGSFTHWFWNFVIAGSFPVVVTAAGEPAVFGFFAFMMLLQILFVWKLMPETKGKSLEALEKDLVRMH